MSEAEWVGAEVTVVRVYAVGKSGSQLYLESKSGQVFPVYMDYPCNFEEVTILLARVDNNEIRVEIAPEKLWEKLWSIENSEVELEANPSNSNHDDSWVGVVRLKKEDITIVDSRGGSTGMSMLV